MKCPQCQSTANAVTDSRPTADGFAVHRRRQCDSCGKRWTTVEFAMQERRFNFTSRADTEKFVAAGVAVLEDKGSALAKLAEALTELREIYAVAAARAAEQQQQQSKETVCG